ncbi:universal stress protein [Streptomyces cinnabarinus]|uniref:Universal stress protein n=1 Tax=Streptomyces cinnabarinus TaxID=67287 RepID=A0ABY7K6T7_9ACTN|nr:universal stress protein [Streptomyces cinnabarinus]WAZ19495.1 universal stress protein [Streptomyces cinnabarinus]
MTGPVVVGLDGSPESVTAAWWAAREAVNRRLPVLLLHSWTTQPLDVPIAQEAHHKRLYGQEVLQQTSAALLHRYADLDLTTELVSAPAARALLDRAENAELLVLGSRGHGSVASFLLGSISLHVLGLAPCPAVAVRADDPAVEAGWEQPAAAEKDEIVVGVGRPEDRAADALLEFAFTTAAAHGCRVRAVTALPLSTTLLAQPGADEVEEMAGARLAETLAPWREKFPDVPVVQHIAMGPATQVLLTASAHARLTVVGRKHQTSHLTWKLGPVAHAALHHVPCPVAVVPTG